MVRIAILGLLALSLAACSSMSQQASPGTPGASGNSPSAPTSAPSPAAGGATPATNAVDPGSVQALRDMGRYLQTLTQFQVAVDLSGERVLTDGQKLLHTASAKLDVQRPNKLRAQMRSARSARDLMYDGKTVVLYMPEQKYYSRATFDNNLADLVERLRARFGVEIPMADLFLWGTPQAPLDSISSAMNAGQDIVDGTLCDQYAFRQGEIDWQIWIATGPRPLPRKLVITNRSDEARPQSVSWIRWNLSPRFTQSVFTFTPPAGAKAAEFVPMKNR
ncbi:DUF2092 domain-containing protein [Cupriavidus taiwanensis]|uniref:DUF2092 domain-containing protein n=1 Tax=Cupriavidus taiwanensis TaxID=164546 RepID=UPI000E137D5A|nr:DUF2092 domain-containing protein [Cupriavidus taiwanensis]SOY64072.1 conserved hypothetical protein; putative periplasmic protein [Cupriavidus taiwanensis]